MHGSAKRWRSTGLPRRASCQRPVGRITPTPLVVPLLSLPSYVTVSLLTPVMLPCCSEMIRPRSAWEKSAAPLTRPEITKSLYTLFTAPIARRANVPVAATPGRPLHSSTVKLRSTLQADPEHSANVRATFSVARTSRRVARSGPVLIARIAKILKLHRNFGDFAVFGAGQEGRCFLFTHALALRVIRCAL